MRKMFHLLFLCALPLLTPAQAIRNEVKADQQETPPSVSITPSSLDFGEQVVKKSSKPRRITVTNSGSKKLYINSVAIEGDNQQDFVMSQDTCTGATITSKKSCVVDVIFTPAATEKRKARLTFTDNAVDSPQNVLLEGYGINSAAVPPKRSGQ